MIRRHPPGRLHRIVAVTMLLAAPLIQADGFRLTDAFGRSLNDRGVLVTDWEGHIANPAVEILVTPPANGGPFPTTATLSSDSARVYFDSPSRVSPTGPTKVLTFATATSSVPVRVAIFPDRDGRDEQHTLRLRLNAAPVTNTFALRVLDQDVDRAPEFRVIVDFSEDRTGFFADPRHRAIVEQAAADWAYFLGDLRLKAVRAGEELTFLWSTNGFERGEWTRNGADFEGFLFYAQGIRSGELRSGGAASTHGFQCGPHGELPLRRSGSYQAEVSGNYNTLGWFLTGSDDDWCVSGNQSYEPNDLYSIAHHEVGHALFFNEAHTRFREFKTRGAVDDPAVVAYHGAPLPVNDKEHFVGVTDRLSGRGAFGDEYHAGTPAGRWLVTKLDLLVARALGYAVRETSAFQPLTLRGGRLPLAVTGAAYATTLPAGGGIPAYDFAMERGSLPAGMQLDRFTGAVTGVPQQAGTHVFTVCLRDQDRHTPPVRAEFTLVTEPAPLLLAQVSTPAAETSRRVSPVATGTGPIESTPRPASPVSLPGMEAASRPGTSPVFTTP